MLIKKRNRKETLYLIGIGLTFGLLYSLISFVNHWQFRTAALDLGMFNHALYNFAHFQSNYFTLDVNGHEVNYFGDHFSPLTVLYAPFLFVFGTYTLLVIQVLAILFGGVGIYRYAKERVSQDSLVPILILIHFFSIWGIFSALSYDFHNNVVAAMLVPWLIYYYSKGEKGWVLVFYILILISKENMALWVAFILMGLVFDGIFMQKTLSLREALRFEVPLIVFAFLYMGIVVGVVMPALREGGGLDQLDRYAHLGDSLGEIVTTIITHPKYVFMLLFESPVPEGRFIGEKSETHFMLLLSGGFLLITRPHILIMLIPIYAQKMLSNNHSFWGINGQYSIEFVPILSLGLISYACQDRLTFKERRRSIALITLITLVATIASIDNRTSNWYNKVNLVFYQSRHYESGLNLKAIYDELGKIPPNAIVSVQANLAPHLALRDKLYHFPVVKDSEYIVLLRSKRSIYPLKSEEELTARIDQCLSEGQFEIIYDQNDLLVMKRKQSSLH